MRDTCRIMNEVAKRECIRLYAILVNRYAEYTTAFVRKSDMKFVNQRRHDDFVRDACDYLDSCVPGWFDGTSVPFKLRILVDAKNGRRVA